MLNGKLNFLCSVYCIYLHDYMIYIHIDTHMYIYYTYIYIHTYLYIHTYIMENKTHNSLKRLYFLKD